MTKITKFHFFKFTIRLTSFIVFLISFITNQYMNIILPIIWSGYILDIFSRFFPNKIESMGCQKIFKKNFISNTTISTTKPKGILLTVAVWLSANAILCSLYFILDLPQEYLWTLSFFYGVCDIICILWFCPFQKWFMKNKCCNTCRIYNWDFAMLSTPLICSPNFYTYSLLIPSLILLFIWEYTYHKHPERFYEETNQNLKCKNCKEKRCRR